MERIDALTGLPTFHDLRSALAEPVPAVFLDVDGLRFVNYRDGHLEGDDALRRLGAWLQHEAAALRGQVFRVAGDEFLVLLPGRAFEEAAAIAERLIAASVDGITLSAVVFVADAPFADRLRDSLDACAELLYRRELDSGRERSNVVIYRDSLRGSGELR